MNYDKIRNGSKIVVLNYDELIALRGLIIYHVKHHGSGILQHDLDTALEKFNIVFRELLSEKGD